MYEAKRLIDDSFDDDEFWDEEDEWDDDWDFAGEESPYLKAYNDDRYPVARKLIARITKDEEMMPEDCRTTTLTDGSAWFINVRLHRLYLDDGAYVQFATPQELEEFVKENGLDYGAGTVGYQEPKVVAQPLEKRLEHEIFRHGNYAFIKLPPDVEMVYWEGKQMDHCLGVKGIAQDYCSRMAQGGIDVLSMVDLETGLPVVDIEVALTRPSYNVPVDRPTVTQIRGKRNQVPPDDDYLPALKALFDANPEWTLAGHGVKNFDSRIDGDLFVERVRELGI